jgi:hypothetical protein
MRPTNDDAAGVGARGIEDQRVVALRAKFTTARRRYQQRRCPRRLPPGFLQARAAVDGKLPPMTRSEARAFARQKARVRLSDEQRRRELGYPTP